MKTDHLKESNNIEDRRNEGGSASYGSGNARLGNGILRILLAPGSFKSKLVLILLLLFLGGGAGLSGIFDTGTSHHYESTQVSQQSHAQVNDKDAQFVSKVLGTTEVFGLKPLKKKEEPIISPNWSSILVKPGLVVGLARPLLDLFTVLTTKKFTWIFASTKS